VDFKDCITNEMLERWEASDSDGSN
jgi:hypothetical protein